MLASAYRIGLALAMVMRILLLLSLSWIMGLTAPLFTLPAMTVGQIMLVTLYGLVIGEMVTGRHALGLLLGGVAIYLILT